MVERARDQMDVLIGIAGAVACSVSVAGYCWLRMPEAFKSATMLDGDRYEVDEMLAAFGATQEWV